MNRNYETHKNLNFLLFYFARASDYEEPPQIGMTMAPSNLMMVSIPAHSAINLQESINFFGWVGKLEYQLEKNNFFEYIANPDVIIDENIEWLISEVENAST